MTPMLLIALGVALHLSHRVAVSSGVALLLKLSLASVLVMIFAAGAARFEDPNALGNLKPFSRLPTPHIERYMPVVNPSSLELLNAAGVGPDDPLVFFDGADMLNALRFQLDPQGRVIPKRHPAWLPLPSPVVLLPLPASGVVYVDRFLDRHTGGGWLLRRKNTAFQWRGGAHRGPALEVLPSNPGL